MQRREGCACREERGSTAHTAEGLVSVKLAQHLGTNGGERRDSSGRRDSLGILRAALRDRVQHRADAKCVGTAHPNTSHPDTTRLYTVASTATFTVSSVAAASSIAAAFSTADTAALARRAAIAIECRHARLAAQPRVLLESGGPHLEHALERAACERAARRYSVLH